MKKDKVSTPSVEKRLATKTTSSRKSPAKKKVKEVKVVAPPKAARRFKPGVVALRNIKKQVRSVDMCIQRAPFDRLVRKRAEKYFPQSMREDFRFSADAMHLIQRIVEARAVQSLGESVMLTAHCDRDMLKVKDIAQREELAGHTQLAENIRSELCNRHYLLIKCEQRSQKQQQRALLHATATV